MKKIIPVVLITGLIIITLLNVFVLNKSVSSDLDTVVTEYDNKKRTDYVDADGKITVATDKHYATVIKTYDDDKMIEEEYFDDKGRKVSSASGFHCRKRSYNENGKADTDTYYDSKGKQVKTTAGYYAYSRGYNAKGKVNEITYRDMSGNPMNNKYGIAFILRELNKKGKVKREFYFDKNGKPATSNLGQYGVYNKYKNGKVSSRTYLDEEGNPMETYYGYVTVKYTYSDEGVLLETKYFDADDKPVTGKYKEYGDRYEDGHKIYLDKEGKPIFRLDNYLNEHPGVVLVTGICIMMIAFMTKGSKRWLMIALYMAFIAYMTLWGRETGDTRSRFELFWSYRQFFIDPNLRKSVINNIWLFIPFGAMLYKQNSKRYMIPVLVSVVIETVQYFTGLGLCELDDIFSNSLGSMIGYSLAGLFHFF